MDPFDRSGNACGCGEVVVLRSRRRRGGAARLAVHASLARAVITRLTTDGSQSARPVLLIACLESIARAARWTGLAGR